jgi:hypothetical protein
MQTQDFAVVAVVVAAVVVVIVVVAVGDVEVALEVGVCCGLWDVLCCVLLW